MVARFPHGPAGGLRVARGFLLRRVLGEMTSGFAAEFIVLVLVPLPVPVLVPDLGTGNQLPARLLTLSRDFSRLFPLRGAVGES